MFSRFEIGPLVKIVVIAAWEKALGSIRQCHSSTSGPRLSPGLECRRGQQAGNPAPRTDWKSSATILLKPQKVESAAGGGTNCHCELTIVEHGHISCRRPLNWRREAICLLEDKAGRAIAPGQAQLMVGCGINRQAWCGHRSHTSREL